MLTSTKPSWPSPTLWTRTNSPNPFWVLIIKSFYT
jgi:hypothetical protein